MLNLLDRIRGQRANDTSDYHLLDAEVDQYGKLEERNSSETAAGDYGAIITSKEHRWGKIKGRLSQLAILLPSYFRRSDPEAKTRSLHRTAWLDGLRGISAFCVVWHHMSVIWFSWEIHKGWASFNDSIIRFPIIRLAIAGLPNVMVFFVISGYALSYKPLKLLRQEDNDGFSRTLASSLFRRHSRLFIPAVVLSAPSVAITYFGFNGNGESMPGAAVATINPPQLDTFWHQCLNYVPEVLRMCAIFTGDANNWAYNNVLWTLPMEFKCSLVIFGMLLALSRLRNNARMLIVAGVALYSLCYAHWAEFLFVSGMLLADLQFQFYNRPDVPRTEYVENRWWQVKPRCCTFQTVASSALCLASLYVLGMPKLEVGGADAQGFRTLGHMIPQIYHATSAGSHFWPSVAAIHLIFAIDSAPFLQKPFTCGFAQYLGRISYSLYLVHLIILHSFGFRIGKFFVGLTESDTDLHYFTGISLAAIVYWFVTLWVADVGQRFVDANAVRFASWVYGKLSM
ncbi:acyltransferase family-domain-containing protein [Xylariaceae sp. FL0662B]|nr:acyltransferase family-domain-containing protein [Xylariaceae sp. FL0662B]